MLNKEQLCLNYPWVNAMYKVPIIYMYYFLIGKKQQ